MQPADLQRLNELESQICSYQGCACQAGLLEEYLDLGLEATSSQPATWQEGWLQRIFNTLSLAVKNPSSSSSWRKQCLDYLYQPFFALAHIYKQQPQKTCHLCELLKRYETLN
ncbi:MAG: hypothetical protein WAO12_11135 [Venatoribacter sp.]